MDAVDASPQEQQEKEAFAYVRRLRFFYLHLFQYVVVCSVLLAANLIFSPRYLWSLWTIGGWGLAVLLHAIRAFRRDWVWRPDWERREVEKRLGRPL